MVVNTLLQTRERALRLLKRFEGLPALITRISVGWVFIESGWGKLHNLPKVVQYFESLGIPAPGLQAPFVAGTELICGGLLFVGLLARLAAIPLSSTMVVAILTAKRSDISALSDLFSFSEYLYIVLLLWVIVKGPGWLALDCAIVKKFRGPGLAIALTCLIANCSKPQTPLTNEPAPQPLVTSEAKVAKMLARAKDRSYWPSKTKNWEHVPNAEKDRLMTTKSECA